MTGGAEVISDKDFNSLIWNTIDGEKLNELLSGCIICGAEPIDYPLTDGAIIYLRDASGEYAALELRQEPEEQSFYIQFAKIPSGAALSLQAMPLYLQTQKRDSLNP